VNGILVGANAAGNENILYYQKSYNERLEEEEIKPKGTGTCTNLLSIERGG